MKTLWELCRDQNNVFLSGGLRDFAIRNVTDRSAEASEGSLFVTVRGHRFDGAAFAGEAYRNGCRAFLTDRALGLPEDAVTICTPTVLQTAAGMMSSLYDHPERKMRLIGVTGTKGKTSVAWMLRLLAEKAGLRCGLIGTPGICGTNHPLPTQNTTPDGFTVWKTLADLVGEGNRACVMEVSSLALKDGRVAGIPFSVGIFTNLDVDHIGDGAHTDMAEYLTAKRALFERSVRDFAVYDADAKYGKYVVQPVRSRLGVSLCGRGDLNADCVGSDCNGTVFRFGKKNYRLSLGGNCQLKNALCAVAAASHIVGAEVEHFLPFLADVAVPGRFERLTICGRQVIIDYAHNPLSFKTLGEAVSKIRGKGKVIAVFGSVGGRERERRALLGQAGERLADRVILTADNPGFEGAEQICRDIRRGFSDPEKAKIIPDRAQAICYAVSAANPGDTVLLLGKGHEEYQLIEGEKVPFSEKKVLSEYMRRNGENGGNEYGG